MTMQTGGIAGKRVLLVEDDVVTLEILHAIIKAERCEVHTCRNGLQALAKFQVQSFDLVVMDIQMPTLDGKRAVYMIRRWEEQNRDTRCCILAISGTDIELAPVSDLGFSARLKKPITRHEILTTAMTVLKTA